MEMVLKNESIVEPLAAEAIRLGADLLDVEYKDGYEQVFATRAGVRHCQVVEFQPGSRHVAKGTARSREAEAAAYRGQRMCVRAAMRHL